MEIRSVLDGLRGKIHIHSNCGFYHYNAESQSEKCTNFPPEMSIRGTIVLWHIPVKQPAKS